MQKKGKLYKLLALILAGLMILSAVFSAIYMIAAAEEEQEHVSYSIRAEMFEEAQVIRCEETIRYCNMTGEELSQLFFYCYPNVLRSSSSLPFDEEDLASAYPEGFAPGGVQFYSVTVDGEDAHWGMRGSGSFMRVDVSLLPGTSCTVEMAYDILLPVDDLFSGVGSNDWRLTDAFVRVCTYKGGVFVENPMLPSDRSACVDAASWHLEIEVPESYTLCAGGKVTQEGTKWTVDLDAARDLGLVFGKGYRCVSEEMNGVTVSAYAGSDAEGSRVLAYCRQIIDSYSGIFGSFPQKEIAIAMSGYALDAKSTGGLIMIDRAYYASARRNALEYYLALMLAQQYFGEAIGVDPYDEPWLCESVSGYLALEYYRLFYGEDRWRQEVEERVSPSLRVTLPGGVQADSSAAYFTSRSEYDMVLRGRGTGAILLLSMTMGSEILDAALSAMVEERAGTLCDIGDFVSFCDRQGGSWGKYLMDVLATIGTDAGQIEWFE